MKFFSVVVPNLHSPIVDKTIEALERQRFDRNRYEVIVVGMDKYGLIHESDIVIFDRSECPLSPAQARNRGAWQTSGEVIVFLDADCVAGPDWLSNLADCFNNPTVNVVGGGVEWRNQNFWTLADNISMFYDFLSIHQPGKRRLLPSLNLAIRRVVFEEVGGFDERYPRASGEDADLSIRLRQQGHCLHFVPRAAVIHDPPRHRLIHLLRHGYYQGKYSTKVDTRYVNEEGLPGILGTRVGLICFAPILAMGATLRIFWSYTSLQRYWFTAPAIYMVKIAWCLGAANHPMW